MPPTPNIEMPDGRDHSASSAITLAGLVTARWVLLAFLLVCTATYLLQPRTVMDFVGTRPDGLPFAVTLVLYACSTAYASRLVRLGRANDHWAGIHLAIDIIALTALIHFSGGARNPFTTLYFIPITLATLVSPLWTWALSGLALVAFGAHLLIGAGAAVEHTHHHHDMSGHLWGMWIAFGASGVLMAWFVHRIAASVSEQRQELARLRYASVRDRDLALLGTLAAGAAHELGTPLNTIALLAGELSYAGKDERHELARAIEHEVGRCKKTLDKLRSPEVRVNILGGRGTGWPLAELLDDVLNEDSGAGVPIKLDIAPGSESAAPMMIQPREALAQIVRELIANARAACQRRGPEAGIILRLEYSDTHAIISVDDQGDGMTAPQLARVFDPSATEASEAVPGLGLFLARAHIRQLGGTLDIDSRPNHGTRVVVELPFMAPGTHVQTGNSHRPQPD